MEDPRSTLYDHVGSRIRFYRKLKNMTQDQLAAAIHKSESTLSKYESGQISIDIGALYDIASALGTDMSQFVDYAVPKEAARLPVSNPFSNSEKDDVLRLAACLEEHFPHSMANAVVRAAREQGLAHEEMHSEVEYIVAHGIASRVGGERVVIGSHHFVFEDEHCIVPADEQEKFDQMPAEYSHLYMAASGQLVGVICIADPLRPEAASVLRQLHKLGIQNTVMMTGDSHRTAAAIAKQVGVDSFYSEVLPEDKAAFVQKAKAEGHTVVMIGRHQRLPRPVRR